METKVCKGCGKELPLDQFFHNRYGATGYCNDCMSAKRGKKPLPVSEQVAEEKPVSKPRKRYIENVADEELVEELKRRGYAGTLTKRKEFTL